MSDLINLVQVKGGVINPRFNLDLSKSDTIKVLEKGISINESDIDWSKDCFRHDGKIVFLHIKDNLSTSYRDLNNPRKLKKYHFWNCSTLEEMKSKGKGNKYVFSRSNEPVFLVNTKRKSNDRRKLHACHNCINQSKIRDVLNIPWGSFPTHEQILSFMKEKEIDMNIDHKSQYASSTGYSEHWRDISRQLRQSKNWCCEKCGVRLAKYSEYLDVHHKNGIKSDNRPANLEVLCRTCHSNEPNHEHMKREKSYQSAERVIIRQRR